MMTTFNCCNLTVGRCNKTWSKRLQLKGKWIICFRIHVLWGSSSLPSALISSKKLHRFTTTFKAQKSQIYGADVSQWFRHSLMFRRVKGMNRAWEEVGGGGGRQHCPFFWIGLHISAPDSCCCCSDARLAPISSSIFTGFGAINV